MASAQAATNDLFLQIDSIAGESQHECGDTFCSPDVIAYSFFSTGGACVRQCSGWPTDPTTVSLTLSVTKVASSNPCIAKAGAGTLDLQRPMTP